MKYMFDGLVVDGVKAPQPNERILKVVLSPQIGNISNCTVLISIISPGNGTGMHKHDVDEIMYVASGRGVGEVLDEVMELREDVIVFSPKDVEHQVKNTGNETLKLVCFFTPPLKPEGYFKEAISKAKQYFNKKNIDKI